MDLHFQSLVSGPAVHMAVNPEELDWSVAISIAQQFVEVCLLKRPH